MDEATIAKIRASRAYKELTRTRNRLSGILLTVMLVCYFAFFLIIAFAPTALGPGPNQSPAVALAAPLALTVIPVILAGIYIWRANRSFDALAQQVRDEAS
jgi:uncharacterized membrane protein (DUF485 family)